MTLQEYASQIAEAVGRECLAKWRVAHDWQPVDLDAIIASVPPPQEQPEPLPAPTGPGWYWAWRINGGGWQVVNVIEVPLKASAFDAWVGPLVAPTAKGGE